MTAIDNSVTNALCRLHFQFFVIAAFQVIHGRGTYNDAWFVRAMCEEAEKVVSGENDRLLVTIPPRHLKSFVMSVCLPAWWLGRDPSKKVIVASYASSLAEQHARVFRRLVNSDWYEELFPNFGFAEDANRVAFMQTTTGGGFQAVGRRGGVTGFGSNLLILDDVLNAEEARSEIERENAIEFFTGSIRTRFDDQRESKVIIIQQRLHERDLAGYASELGTFFHLNLPAISEQSRTFDLGLGETHRWENGELLDPVRHPQSVLDALRIEMGPIRFNSQYLQNPILPGGNIIRWEWFEEYDRPYERDDYLFVVQSWDTAYSSEDGSCFSVCLTFGFRENKWDLIDIWRRQVDFPDLRAAALRLRRKYRADCVLVEAAASGRSLRQEMAKEDNSSCRWIAITPNGSKEERAWAQSAKLASGFLRIPAEASWLPDFRHEVIGFPNAHYDDQVDALTQFVKYMNTGGGRYIQNTDPVTGRRNVQRRKSIRR